MKHTRISPVLWDWPRFTSLGPTARLLWLALYTSAHAKLHPPGLFKGGIAVMADSARLSAVDTQEALRELLDQDLVAYDDQCRLVAFRELPDRGERPNNGKVLKGFWNRFLSLPDCSVRNEWVELLAWLCQPMPNGMREVWTVTFATISDLVRFPTKTEASQPELFDSDDITYRGKNGIAYQQVVGRKQGSEKKKGGAGGKLSTAARPYSIAEVFEAIAAEAEGRVVFGRFDTRIAKSLWAAIDESVNAGITLDDMRLVGRWLGSGGMAWRKDIGAKWVATAGELIEAVNHATKWHADGEPQLERRSNGRGMTAEEIARMAT